MAKKSSTPGRIEIKQVRSGIGRPGLHRRTLAALGLKKHQSSVIHDDTPAIRGMIHQVRHLVEVRPLAD
ncbi:MAG: 50S ribosomal protein L30 [Gemmatimonadota bacterium]